MWKKIWRWLYRQRWIFFMLALVGATVYFGFENSAFRSAFLFDRYGKFQWVSVTASFGAIGLFINANAKMQEIRANLVFKNQLEILENFRQDCSKLNAAVWTYNNKLDGIVATYKTNAPALIEEEIPEKVDELNSIYEKQIKPNLNLVRLDSAINKDSKKTTFFKNSLDNLMDTLEQILKKLTPENYQQKTFEADYQLIIDANNNFLEDAQKYVNIVFKKQNDRIS